MRTLSGKTKLRCGVSMVEVVVSTMIVGSMLLVALDTLGAVYRTQRINSLRLTGPELAHELMAEVLAMPYEDPEGAGNGTGAETGESTATRAAFDDVDDYNNWSSANARAKDGTALVGYTGWLREIDVWWADRINGVFWFSETGLKKIRVRVTDPDGKIYEFCAFRQRNGLLERTPAIDTTAVTWMGAELRLGGSSQSARMSTNLCNQATDN